MKTHSLFTKYMFVLVLVAMLTAFWSPATAQTATAPAGSGTEGDPYQIATLNNLYWISQNDTEWDKHYELTNNIDASSTSGWDGGAGWDPIGEVPGSRFSGSIDGNGFTITGLFINRPSEDHVGLFGIIGIGGRAENIRLENVDVTGSNTVGGLVGITLGTITNSYATGSVDGNDIVGGLVGNNQTISTITGSYATGSVSGSNNVGGLVGWNLGTVTGSYATGSVSGSNNVGGLVGINAGGTVSSSYATGSVSGNSIVGGLVGNNEGLVTDSYWSTETGGPDNGIGTGLTSAEMRAATNFTGFDFTNTWQIGEYLSFPVLQDNTQDPAPGLIFGEGDGSELEPYEIATAEQLNAVRGDLDAHYVLTADIDLDEAPYNTGTGWDPIGEFGNTFTGTIDGNGFTVTGLFIDRSGEDRIGLFGMTGTGAEVENMQLLNVDVTGGNNYTGGLVGFNIGTVTGSYTTGSVDGDNTVGGLVGNNQGVLTGSYATSSVSGSNQVGGLVGENQNTVTGSYASGSVSGFSSRVGGLMGFNNGGTVTTSYWNTDSGSPDNGIGTGLTSAEMRAAINLTGFDFTNTWDILEGYAFPVLQNNPQDPPPGLIPPDAPAVTNPTDDAAGVALQPLLNWDDASAESENATGSYELQVSENEDFSAPFINQTGMAASEHQVNSDLDIGTTIYWRVRALNSAGESGWAEFSFTTTLFTMGNGIETDPYEIATAEQLNAVRGVLDAHYILTADIDLGAETDHSGGAFWNGGAGWDPIGDNGNNFTGSIDGNGFTITGLFINRPSEDHVGLFGIIGIGGHIENIRLENVNVTGRNNVGSMVGNNNGGTVTGSHATGSVNGNNYTGGLVGHNSGTVTGSYATTGSVDGNGRVGGLVGRNLGTVTGSYATNSVNGFNNVGGLVGRNEFGSTVTDSYAAGGVDGNSGIGIGSLVGHNDGGTVTDSYWNTDSGSPDNGIGTGLTSAEMRTAASFTGFDFETPDTWDILEDFSYPYLTAITQDPPPGLIPPDAPAVTSPADDAASVALQPLLNWEDASAASGNATDSYELQVSENDDFSTPFIDQTGMAATEHQLNSDLDIGTTIYWRVRGINDAGTGDWAEFSFTTTFITTGDGSEGFPYEIATAEQLNEIRHNLGAHYILTADIDLDVAPYNTGTGWEPTGTFGNEFTGSIDGNGHTITGLFVAWGGEDYVGLFGRTGVGAEIENMQLIEVDVTGKNFVGGLVGFNIGTVTGSYATGSVNGDSHVGGLVGRNHDIVIGSYATGSVDGDSHVGGLVGFNTGTVTGSYATGNVIGDTEVGGLAGDNRGVLTGSYSTGSVDGDTRVGGLVGENTGAVTESYWNTETSGQAGSDGGTGLTSAEMREAASFTGFDFDDTWQIDEVSGGSLSFPYLQDNPQDPPPGYLEVELATVETGDEATNIEAASAEVTGEVTGDGNLEVTDRGFVWAAETGPDTGDNVVPSGSGTGSFGETLSNLPPGTKLFVRSYAVNAAGTAYGNEITFTTGQAELTIGGAFTAHDKTYDGNGEAAIDENNLSVQGAIAGHDAISLANITLAFEQPDAGIGLEVTITGAELAGVDAGKYTVSLSVAPVAVADITPVALTVEADDQTKVYGEGDPELTYQLTAGALAGGDTFTGTLSRTGDENAGSYTIEQGDLDAGANYAITFSGAEFTITPKTLQVTAEDQAKAYGNADPTLTFTADGFEFGEDESVLTGSLEREAGEAVGTYEIQQGDLEAGDNYTITFTGAEFTIEGGVLTVTADDQAKTYGETDPEFTYTVSGFIGGDDESVLSGSLSRIAGEEVGTYVIEQGNLSAGGNYDITLDPGELSITPKTLEVVADAQSKAYGDDDPALTYTATGFELGDDESVLTGSLSREAGEAVGTYAIGQGGLDAGDNYAITFTGAEFTITGGGVLTITADEVTKTYGQADPQLTYTVTGFAEGDDASILTGSLSREEGEAVGTYQIRQGNLSAGDNYAINFTGAEFTIEGGVLTVTADQLSKTYGEADPELTFTASGFAGGDDESVLTGSLSRESDENVGEYAITQGDLSAGENYMISFEPGELSITPKTLTVTADNGLTKITGQDDPVLTFTATGFAFEEDQSILSGNLDRQAGETPGEYAIIPGDLSAGINYTIDFTGDVFRILRTPPVVLSATPEDESALIPVDVPVQVVFDQPVQIANSGRIRLEGANGGSTAITPAIEDDNVLVVAHDGLNHLTAYEVVVEAGAIANLDGVGNEEDIRWSFTTIVQAPEQVTLASPADSVGSVAAESITLQWEPEPNAGSYQLALAQDEDFESIVSEEQGLELTSFSYEDLDYSSVYYWRVRAVNKNSAGPWSDTAVFATQLLNPQPVFPADGAQEISIAPVLEWDSGYEEVEYAGELSTGPAFENADAFESESDGFYEASGLAANATYYWRVRLAGSLAGIPTESGWSPVFSFTTRADPSEAESEPVSVSFAFGNSSDPQFEGEPRPQDYWMLGLPGSDGLPLDAVFEGPYPESWRAFYETGAEVDFLDEYTPEDSRFVFDPGLGFWILSTEAAALNQELAAVEVDGHDRYGIAVHPGWNIIANPFQKAVDWEAVQAANQITADLYHFDGQYGLSGSLEAFTGYYFYNDPAWDLQTLYIPYSNREKQNPKQLKKDVSEDLPFLALEITYREGFTSRVEFEQPVSAGKTAVFTKPHPSLEYARLGAVITDDSGTRNAYRSVLADDKHPRLLQVKAPAGTYGTWSLSSRNIEPDDQPQAVLAVNKATNKTVLMEPGQPQEVQFTEPLSRYQVFVGELSTLQQMQTDLLPTAFELSQNYPNPFNPATHIRYAVPERANVTLEIYDLLGRKVQTLVNEQQRAGWHLVRWDASALASGMYLYRLRAGDNISTKKLTLIK